MFPLIGTRIREAGQPRSDRWDMVSRPPNQICEKTFLNRKEAKAALQIYNFVLVGE
jgi:hypothetical protein